MRRGFAPLQGDQCPDDRSPGGRHGEMSENRDRFYDLLEWYITKSGQEQ